MNRLWPTVVSQLVRQKEQLFVRSCHVYGLVVVVDICEALRLLLRHVFY